MARTLFLLVLRGTFRARFTRYPEIPIILAGGLNSENVRSAIEYVHPFGVDVNSGTKALNGFKDTRKMQEFIVQAKRFTKAQT